MSYNNRVLSNDNFDCKLSISVVPRNVTVSVEKKSRTMKQIATSADFVRVFLARSENHARFFPARKVKNGKSGSNSNLRERLKTVSVILSRIRLLRGVGGFDYVC